ncbi:MAG: hypothetical protein WCT08_02395 [Patescibacteria group bacterium]|jgi:hypothetical protein
MKAIFVILIGVFALGFLNSCGNGYLKQPENIISRVSADIDIRGKGVGETTYTWFTVTFETKSGKNLCGGIATIHANSSVGQPASYPQDIVNSALLLRVPDRVETVDILIAYGPFSFGPYLVGKNDTTIVVDISGGC